MGKSYIVPEERLMELLIAENELYYLKYAGVDNWEGYGFEYDSYMRELASDFLSGEDALEDVDEKYVARIELNTFEEVK